jgi:pheromone shutdown protein TraB
MINHSITTMITIIGTKHIYDLSKPLIKIFNEISPDLICVEMGKNRYESWLLKKFKPDEFQRRRNEFRYPFTLRQIDKFENNLARKRGISPAEEIHMSIFYAQAHKIPYEFVDIDSKELTEVWNSISLWQRSFLAIIFTFSRFLSILIPNIIFEIILKFGDKLVKDREIGISKAFDSKIIDYRNEFMVNNLKKLLLNHQKIILCVGDGHVPGISKLLSGEGVQFRSIRFKELISNINIY